MSNQIYAGGYFRTDEALASGTVKPGMLLERTSDNAVKAHASEGGFAERMVAIEDALQGKTTADSYATTTRVLFNIMTPGSDAYVYVKAGEDIDIGDKLISSGSGSLIENGSEDSSTVVKQIIAYALEAKDLSGLGAVDTLTLVRFL